MKRLFSLSLGAAGATLALLAPLASAANTCAPPYCPAAKAVTTAATDITSSTATLSGIVNTNGSDTTYHLEVGQSPSTFASPDATISGTTSGDQAVSTTVTGLQPETAYSFRVLAANQGGTTSGAWVSFTTAKASVNAGSSAGGPSVSAPSNSPSATVIAKRSAATVGQIASVLETRGVAALLDSHGVVTTFAAPTAGTVKNDVFAMGVPGRAFAARHKFALLARGTHRFAKAGTAKVRLKPTAQRALLKHGRRIRVLIRTTFTPVGGESAVQRDIKTLAINR